MSVPRFRVVFDCNVYFQALISTKGPAGACVRAAFDAKVALFISQRTIDEFVATASKPTLRSRFAYSDDAISAMVERVRASARFVDSVADQFEYARDPSDAHYINLALATGSRYVVTRDKDLRDLADLKRPEAREFRLRFPMLDIIEPTELLVELSRIDLGPHQ